MMRWSVLRRCPDHALNMGWSTMKTVFAFALAACGALLATTAGAYEIDPLTRLPLTPVPTVQDGRVGYTPIPREEVAYGGPYASGTIFVSTEERRLYFVLPGGRAMKYGVGV